MKKFIYAFFGLILNIMFRMTMLTQSGIGFIIAQVGIAITGPIVSKKLNDMKAWIGANVFHKVQDCCAVPALPEGESTMEPGETSFEEIQPRYHRIGFVHNDGRIW